MIYIKDFALFLNEIRKEFTRINNLRSYISEKNDIDNIGILIPTEETISINEYVDVPYVKSFYFRKQYRREKPDKYSFFSKKILKQAIAQTGINKTLTEKLKEYEDNIARAENYIKHFEAQKSEYTVTEEDIRKLIDELKEYMSNPKSIVTTKFILSQYIERVDVSNETILVTLKVTMPPTAGGNSFCPIILHKDSIRRKKVINSSSTDNIILLQ